MLPGYAERLAALRRARGWGAPALAAAAGRPSHSLIFEHERESKTPTLGVIAQLAAALGVSAGQLAFGDRPVPGAFIGTGATFDERLASAQAHAGLSLGLLAEHAGSSSSLLSKWKRDKIPPGRIYAEHVLVVARVLSACPKWLGYGEVPQAQPQAAAS